MIPLLVIQYGFVCYNFILMMAIYTYIYKTVILIPYQAI